MFLLQDDIFPALCSIYLEIILVLTGAHYYDGSYNCNCMTIVGIYSLLSITLAGATLQSLKSHKYPFKAVDAFELFFITAILTFSSIKKKETQKSPVGLPLFRDFSSKTRKCLSVDILGS